VFGPKYISDLLIHHELSRSCRISGAGLLSVPIVRTKHREAAFSFYGPYMWNKLPENCRSASTLLLFKIKPEYFPAHHFILLIDLIKFKEFY